MYTVLIAASAANCASSISSGLSSLCINIVHALRSVFIISNREISNRASQILKAKMLLIRPYCLKFQIARV